MDLEQKLLRISGGLDGSTAIYSKDLADAQIVEVNSQKIYSAASTIKIPLVMLMMEKYTRISTNQFSLLVLYWFLESILAR